MVNITELLVEKVNEISHQIDRATQEIKAFIENKAFEENVTFLVNQLMNHITMFYTERTDELKYKLNQTCQKFTVESIFVNMKSLLDTNTIAQQLKVDGYSDAAFERIETIYKSMMKQLLIAFPICETLVFGEKNGTTMDNRNEHIVKLVAEIEEELKNEKLQNTLNKEKLDLKIWAAEIRDLKKTVQNFKQRFGYQWERVLVYGKAPCDEQFAILVTSVVRSTVTLFSQKKNRICDVTYNDGYDEEWLKQKNFWTAQSAADAASSWIGFLKNGEYDEVFDA
uniref:Uncharacterized protein n=1 Tax=Panagrolaimus sp. ES5 TaxID=591445 RepID=A0AC34F9V6_9BILA